MNSSKTTALAPYISFIKGVSPAILRRGFLVVLLSIIIEFALK